MNKLNEVNINIQKALISNVSIKLSTSNGEPKATFDVSGSLLTREGRDVAGFSFSSQSWYSEDHKIDIKPEVHKLAADIFKLLNIEVYRKMNDIYPALSEINRPVEEVKEEVDQNEVIHQSELDEVTDRFRKDDEIPF